MSATATSTTIIPRLSRRVMSIRFLFITLAKVAQKDEKRHLYIPQKTEATFFLCKKVIFHKKFLYLCRLKKQIQIIIK